MSAYTDFEHERALKETLYWEKHPPVIAEEQYKYGEYQYRLKDFQKALEFYQIAAKQGFVPAMYRIGECFWHGLGCEGNKRTAQSWFAQSLVLEKEDSSPEAVYRTAMCYTYGYAAAKDEEKALRLFKKAGDSLAAALYEIGLFYRDGKGSVQVDVQQASAYLRRAYDGRYEEAIFALFALFEGPFEQFPYQREIKEAYSFCLGRLMRVAELNPCPEYLVRLGDFYRRGYPGDTGEKLQKFEKLAQKYYKKAGVDYVK